MLDDLCNLNSTYLCPKLYKLRMCINVHKLMNLSKYVLKSLAKKYGTVIHFDCKIYATKFAPIPIILVGNPFGKFVLYEIP